MFSPGDIVICIVAAGHQADQTPVPLTLHNTYQVWAVRKCPKCGADFIDIGFQLAPSQWDIVCNCQYRFNDGIWWLGEGRFKKVDQGAKSIEITLTETVTRTVTLKIQ